MMVDKEKLVVDEVTVQVHKPVGVGGYPVLLLLHGWTGDEKAMWVFSSRLPKDMLMIAPRGIYNTPLGGYGWYPHRSTAWPWIDDFNHAIQILLNLLSPLNFPEADFSKMHIVGFSQGAALAYAFALLQPMKVNSIVGLSGFLPEGSEAIARNRPLMGKPAFIAHGSKDGLVPVGRARYAAQVLESAGAKVTYCEDDVGHKLSSSCFKGMEAFFAGNEV